MVGIQINQLCTFYTKKTGNKIEMPIPERINSKAFQEFLFNNLRERIFNRNIEIIDRLVYGLYGLTEEEIRIMEGG